VGGDQIRRNLFGRRQVKSSQYNSQEVFIPEKQRLHRRKKKTPSYKTTFLIGQGRNRKTANKVALEEGKEKTKGNLTKEKGKVIWTRLEDKKKSLNWKLKTKKDQTVSVFIGGGFWFNKKVNVNRKGKGNSSLQNKGSGGR